MSVSAIVTALQAVHAAISGVKTASGTMPDNLATAELPLVAVWPAEAEWGYAAMDQQRQARTYIVRVFVRPVAQDLPGPDPGYNDCVALLQAFGEAYKAHSHIAAKADIMWPVRDSGISGGSIELTWGNTTYWGFVFRVQIEEKE